MEKKKVEKLIKPLKDKTLCGGCYNNDYNWGLGGAKECWSFKSAKITRRKQVPLDQVPPWTQLPIYKFNCYQRRGYVFIDCSKKDRQY